MGLTPAERQARHRARKRESIMLIKNLELTADERDALVDAGYAMFQQSEDADHIKQAICWLISELPSKKRHT